MSFLVRAYKNIRSYIHHHLLTVAFLFGFILDNLTLNRVDQVFDNIVLFAYVILAMLSILLLYTGISERYGERVSRILREKSPLLMQYAFGGLLSGMLIFYGRSGSVVDSWPFLLLILGVIFGNETIKQRGERLVYNLTIFFVGLFAYLVLVIPVFLGKMGSVIFVGSGLIALALMSFLIVMVERIVPNFMKLQKRKLVFIIGLIYLTLNTFYFTNLIPPIPLSMKHVGIYHSVVRYENNSYELTYEKPRWWQWYRKSDSTFHYSRGESIFCYAAVFAPARLSTDIYHHWEYYDEEKREWVDRGRYSYSIAGGRDEGYRGYTEIRNYREGEWRCTVETEQGQVIGKEEFTISSGVRAPLMTRRE